MDLKSPHKISDHTEGGATKQPSQSESISEQPKANGNLRLLHSGVVRSSEAPPHVSSTCGTNERRLSSTKSHAPFKTDAAHIKEVAGNDCCAHCLLACLFCELLSMCSALGECLACGVDGACCCDVTAGCCCVEVACTEEACQAVLDCGMLESCCASSDCLEICLECCSIVFPS